MSTQLLDTSKFEAQLERMKQDSQGGIPADMPAHYDTPFEKFHKYVAKVKADPRYTMGSDDYKATVDDKLYSKLTDYYKQNKLATEIPSKEDFAAGNFIKQDEKKNSAFAPVALATTGFTEATARLAKVATKGAMKAAELSTVPGEKVQEAVLKYTGHKEDADYLSTAYNKFWEENNKVPAKIGDVADTLHAFGDQYSNGGLKDEFLYRGGGEMIATWPLFGPINKAATGLKSLPLLGKALPLAEKTWLGKMAIARLENATEGYMFGVSSGSIEPFSADGKKNILPADVIAFAAIGAGGDALAGYSKASWGVAKKFFSKIAGVGGKPLVDEVLQAAAADVKMESPTAQKVVDVTKDIIEKTKKAYPKASKKQVFAVVAKTAAAGADQAIVDSPDLLASKVESDFNKVVSTSKDLQSATGKVEQFAKSVGDDTTVTAASSENIVEKERVRTGRKNPKKAATAIIDEGTSETADKSAASSVDKKAESLTRVKKAIASAKELQNAGDTAGRVSKSLAKVAEVSGNNLPMTEKVTAAMDDSYNQKEQVYKLSVGAAGLNSFEFTDGLLNMLGVNMKMASKHKLLTLWGLKDEAKAFLGSQGLNGNIQKAFEDSLLDAVRAANKRPNLTAEEATVAANKLVEKHLAEMTRTGHLAPGDKRGVFGSSNFFDAATVWQKQLQSESDNAIAVAKKLAKKLKNNPSAASAVGDIIDKIEAEAKNKPKPGPGAANTFDPAFGQNPSRQLSSGVPQEWLRTLSLTGNIGAILHELPFEHVATLEEFNRGAGWFPSNAKFNADHLKFVLDAYNKIPVFRKTADAISHWTSVTAVSEAVSDISHGIVTGNEDKAIHDVAERRHLDSVKDILVTGVSTLGGQVDVTLQKAVEDAKLLLSAVRKAPQLQKPLYRGVSSQTRLPILHDAKVGDEIVVSGVKGFSESSEEAEKFIRNYDPYKYSLEVLPGAQTVKTGPFGVMPNEQEHLSQGVFEVMEIHPHELWPDSRRVLVLKPKGVF